ncbi:hypothetical protein LTR36_000290 [Oleoguttula mirabilis]|uniref:Senescence domain-containing protein n=1 Tax=Oleoguttula mirabilis TaxID=1507867 RepID=A0AAV9JY40_9PEZI|nr:hypothetical protein LTR36_000290 [Oleoguttula mirabilis]
MFPSKFFFLPSLADIFDVYAVVGRLGGFNSQTGMSSGHHQASCRAITVSGDLTGFVEFNDSTKRTRVPMHEVSADQGQLHAVRRPPPAVVLQRTQAVEGIRTITHLIAPNMGGGAQSVSTNELTEYVAPLMGQLWTVTEIGPNTAHAVQMHSAKLTMGVLKSNWVADTQRHLAHEIATAFAGNLTNACANAGIEAARSGQAQAAAWASGELFRAAVTAAGFYCSNARRPFAFTPLHHRWADGMTHTMSNPTSSTDSDSVFGRRDARAHSPMHPTANAAFPHPPNPTAGLTPLAVAPAPGTLTFEMAAANADLLLRQASMTQEDNDKLMGMTTRLTGVAVGDAEGLLGRTPRSDPAAGQPQESAKNTTTDHVNASRLGSDSTLKAPPAMGSGTEQFMSAPSGGTAPSGCGQGGGRDDAGGAGQGQGQGGGRGGGGFSS